MSDEGKRRLAQLGRALDRLAEALGEPAASELAIDGTIRRFEFTFELLGKTLKRFLGDEGIETATPREALQRSYQAGWLAEETVWLDMLRSRNRTSHVYDEAEARQIYEEIRRYFPEMKKAFDVLARRTGD